MPVHVLFVNTRPRARVRSWRLGYCCLPHDSKVSADRHGAVGNVNAEVQFCAILFAAPLSTARTLRSSFVLHVKRSCTTARFLKSHPAVVPAPIFAFSFASVRLPVCWFLVGCSTNS